MAHNISPVLHPGELSLVMEKAPVILIDASAGKASEKRYLENHLMGALYVNMDSQLSDIKADAAEGGRHPLPTPQQFAALLTQLGITPEAHVIIYDDKNGANAASRLWWMLKAIGHEAVQVIDGGFQAAVDAGFPTTSTVPAPEQKTPYEADSWKLPLADLEEVKSVAQEKDHLLIDVRDSYRYLGESEPIDLVAGHIPGAVNIPFSENLDEKGFFKSPGELKEKYNSALEGKDPNNVIVHCGSGVTACHTLLAMDHAGMEIPKLYVGSWSEWSRRDLPIATKER